MKNGTVPIGTTQMQYVSFGTGEKTAVVLPGLSDGLATVGGKALILSMPYRKYLGEYTVYLFSRKNEMPDGYSMEEMADDQAQAMRTLGIDSAYVLGVSQGGMIAQLLAARHPEMVTKLVPAVTASVANPVVTQVISGWMEMAERGDHLALMTDTAEKMYSETYLQKNRRYLPVLARFTKPDSYDRFLVNARAILNFDARSVLPDIRCPTLIIAGSEDITVGREAAGELHEAIAHSELFVYEGLGHGLFEEAKDFYERVFAFFSR